MTRRPHICPACRRPFPPRCPYAPYLPNRMKLVLAYKNFAANRAVSHIGLGVTALNAVKTMRAAGIDADVWPIVSAADLCARLRSGAATHVQVAAFLTALRMKGETVGELIGLAEVMRWKAVRVRTRGEVETALAGTDREMLIDTCGTGGDRAGSDLGGSGMRSTSFILAFAFLISSSAMAGSAEGNLPGVGTFAYSGSPIATASPLIVGSRY